MNQIIGKCSICGGDVSVPSVYHSTIPPVPQCQNCGATKKSTLPVIQMEDEKLEKRTLLTETRNPYNISQG